jgi:hypothetical protein
MASRYSRRFAWHSSRRAPPEDRGIRIALLIVQAFVADGSRERVRSGQGPE